MSTLATTGWAVFRNGDFRLYGAARFLTGLASLGGRSTFYWDAWRAAGDGGPGLTWSDRNLHAAAEHEPERRIDYVLSRLRGTTGHGRPLECRVVGDTPVDGVWPTDHFGVLAVQATPG